MADAERERFISSVLARLSLLGASAGTSSGQGLIWHVIKGCLEREAGIAPLAHRNCLAPPETVWVNAMFEVRRSKLACLEGGPRMP